MLTVFRKEIKYVIPIELFARMEERLAAVMHRDSHNRGTYEVRSQYFDSLDDRDLWDNLDGMEEKRKIRVRIYSPDAQRAKLEYKCKSGADGVKYSLDISREEALMMENCQYGFLMKRSETLAHQMYIRLTCGVYAPRTLVVYDRTAFTYPVNDVRVTFDHNLRGSASPYGLFEDNPFLIPVMAMDVGVLEVKYNDFLPAPIKAVVQETDSLAEANSKYTKARFINV